MPVEPLKCRISTTGHVVDNPPVVEACQQGLCEPTITHVSWTELMTWPGLVLEQGIGGTATDTRSSFWPRSLGCGPLAFESVKMSVGNMSQGEWLQLPYTRDKLCEYSPCCT